jgi:hypothetical protein
MKPLWCLAGFALAASMQLPAAHACFDGFSVTSKQVSATVHTDGKWRLSEARTMARWTARLDALLSKGGSLAMQTLWSGTVCGTDDCQDVTYFGNDEDTSRWTLDAKMARVFETTAKTLGRSPQQLTRARQAKAVLYSVQIASFRSAGRARNLVDELNLDAQMGDMDWEAELFYSAGGYPAIHNPVHEVAVDVGGTTFHRVVAGLFVDPDDAQAYRTTLAKNGFVSSLSVEQL